MNSLKKTLVTLLAAGFLLTGVAVRAEFVFTRDGNVLECRIIQDAPASIRIRLKNGKIRTIRRNNIIRILYTRLYMGKVYVQKTDGNGLEVYMVDEDQNEYTFRKDLYKPAEFKIRRNDVLFIARKNPSGLRGEAEPEQIHLTWHPPYNRVKSYNIYYKAEKRGEYVLAGTTASKKYTITGLKSNTVYYTKVTAVDHENYESQPTNVFKITTKNIKPLPPEQVDIDYPLSPTGNTVDIKLSWSKSTDRDGRIIKYEIYQVYDAKTKKIAVTRDLHVTVKNIPYNATHSFFIRSIDNHNDRSNESKPVQYGSKTYITLRPVFAMPLRTMGEMHKPGFGGLVSIEQREYLWESIDLGIETGAVRFTGKENIEQSILAPLTLTAGYRFKPAPTFHIRPRLAAGISFNFSIYDEDGFIAGEKPKNDTHWSIEPTAMAGLFFIWQFSAGYNISIGAEYGSIIETSGLYDFALFSTALGIRF